MKRILIKNGLVIDPSQHVNCKLDLAMGDGKITWIGNGNPPEKDTYHVIDAAGKIVTPGFIDLHCHLRQPGFEQKETIATGSKAAVCGGFTTICAMPNTNPPIDNAAYVNYVKQIASNESFADILPIGCISKNRQGESLAELGEMAGAGVIGFSDDGSSTPSACLLKQAMEYSLALDLPIIEHCEDANLTQLSQVNEGIIATRLGLAGIPNAAEDIIVARDLSLADLTGARLHLCHISTKGAVDLIRLAKKSGVRVTAEVTPHHLTMTEERVLNYNTSAKVNPPLRTKNDVEALIGGLIDGTIDAIATDHAPHTENDKNCEFAIAPFGISGFETAFASLMQLVHKNQLSLSILVEKLTASPARIIGNKHGISGALRTGDPANVVIIDPDVEWTVIPGNFYSKGKNTPLAGEKLKGKICTTILNGKIVHQEEIRDKENIC